MPADEPKDYEIGYAKPPVGTQFRKGNRANARGRPRGSESLAKILKRALDAPAAVNNENGRRGGRRLTKRELMIRGLVERSAGADLAATKLLLELLGKADPSAISPNPEEAAPLGQDALTRLKERLARLARAQQADPANNPPPHPSRQDDAADHTETTDPAASTDLNETPISE